MLLKLPVVIAIELVIGILSFLGAGDKAGFGDVALVFTFLTLFFALTYFIFKKIKKDLVRR